MTLRTAILLVMPAAWALGQRAGVPRLGWLAEAEGARPVWGVPGGATAGEAISFGRDARMARLNPHFDAVFAVRGEAATPSIGVLSAAGVEWQALEGAEPNPALAVWSPAGQALALVGPAGVQVFTRSGTGTGFAWRQSVPGTASAVAVSDSGEALLLRQQDDLLLWQAGQAALVSREAAGDFTFFAQSDSYAFQTGAELVFAGPGGEAARVARTAPQPLAAGRQLLVLRSENEASVVDVFAASGALLRSLPCGCQASGWRTAAPEMFELATEAEGPHWMTSGERLFFVPARPAMTVAEGEGN